MSLIIIRQEKINIKRSFTIILSLGVVLSIGFLGFAQNVLGQRWGCSSDAGCGITGGYYCYEPGTSNSQCISYSYCYPGITCCSDADCLGSYLGYGHYGQPYCQNSGTASSWCNYGASSGGYSCNSNGSCQPDSNGAYSDSGCDSACGGSGGNNGNNNGNNGNNNGGNNGSNVACGSYGSGSIIFPSNPLNYSMGNTSLLCSPGTLNSSQFSGGTVSGGSNGSPWTWTCYSDNYGSSVSCSAPSTATQVQIVIFNSNQTSVSSGGSTTLNWNSVNASSCTGSGGWNGSEPTSGSATVNNLTSSTSFTLTCRDTNGNTASQSTYVTVGGQSGFSLTVNKSIGGSVRSADGDIYCGTTCLHIYNFGSNVTLTAYPDTSNWKFIGWTGDCNGSSVCHLIVNSAKLVTALFIPNPSVYQEF